MPEFELLLPAGDFEKMKFSVAHLDSKKPIFGFDNAGVCIVTYFSLPDAIAATGIDYKFLQGNRSKGVARYIDGITYKRSNITIRELKEGVHNGLS